MKLTHYYRILLPTTLLAFGHAGLCQNIPNLSQTSPVGSLTQSYTLPNPFYLGAYHDTNMVSMFIPKVPVQDSSSVKNLSDTNVINLIAYFDNFGAIAQSIRKNYSKTNNIYRDMVQIWDNRSQPDKFSYLPYSVDDGQEIRDQDFYEQQQYYNDKFPDELYTSFSKTEYYSDVNIRGTRSYSEGKSQIGQNRYSSVTKISNSADQVRIWNVNAQGLPQSNAFYSANQLYGEMTVDQDSNTVAIFKDKSGNPILKMIQLATSNYLYTYYVYDSIGSLRYILPPMAVAASTNGVVPSNVLNNLCFQYQYDNKARIIAERKPDESSFTNFVYDRKQRIVMRQTPLESTLGNWEINFYDGQDRIIATSLLHNGKSRQTWQDEFDNYTGASYPNSAVEHYLLEVDGEGLYPGELTITGNTMMSYIYYDNYNFSDPNGSLYAQLISNLAFNETLSTPGAEVPEQSGYTNGLVTGTMERILPAPGVDTSHMGDWTNTITWYDQKGRKTFVLSQNLYKNTPLITQYAGIQYDFSGKVLISKHKIVNSQAKDGHTTHTELIKNIYEPVTGRLIETDHNVDGGTWNILAKYNYDDFGRISRQTLGDYGEVRDYSYNIRGQLTGINGLYAESGNKQGESRSFGESLKYDYGFTNPSYDGKLAGMVWRGSGGAQDKALAYGYTYDPAGRLTTADFREGQDQNGLYVTPTLWDNDTMDYSVSNLTYDKNGNILSKDMRGPGFAANNVPIPATIDRLTYAYTANSNRLASVSDAVSQNYGDGDFQDGNTDGNDYAYDADGNLSKDLNKGISSISYTYFDKPQVITFSNGSLIKYSYNAAGMKTQELVDATTVGKVTNYIGNFVYQNDSLQYISTGVGRTVWDLDTVKEEYFVKDHLGNVRSIIDVYHYPILQYLATYEIASAQLEEMYFDDVDSIRTDKPGSTDPTDTKAGKLNGADPDERTGTSILLKVMAGDKVEMNVDNYYDGTYNSEDDQPVTAEDMLNSIVTTLTTGTGGLGSSESHNPDLVPRLFNSANYTEADEWMHQSDDPSRPKAFLNYILFDEHMQVVRTFTGAWQANGSGGWQAIGTDEPMTIPVNGYLAVYVSNASSFAQCTHCNIAEGDVFFDKLKIKFTRGNLKEENHYYPYGLPMAAIGSSAMGMTLNRQKYQSNEYITEAGLNWMSFGARQYDPQIGRFLSVDPMAAQGGQEMLSPYQAMGDNPANYIDPDGKILVVDKNDQNVIAILNEMLGEGNYSIGDNGVVALSPWQEATVFNNLFNFFAGGGSFALLGGGDMGGSGTTLTAAFAYASKIFQVITGQDPDIYSIGLSPDGKLTFGKTSEMGDFTANTMAKGTNDQPNWLARFTSWLDNLLHDNNDPMPEKHNTDHGGTESMGQNHGENQETRVTTRNDIKKYKVDWILDMSDAYTPEIFPHLILPHFLQNMGNVTDNINAMNAAIEIDKEAPKFHIVDVGHSHSISADNPDDTTGMQEALDRHIDSIDKATGGYY